MEVEQPDEGIDHFNAVRAHNLDGASSDEEEGNDLPLFNPILHRHPYASVAIETPVGNPEHRLAYPFVSGLNANSRTPASFENYSPIQLITSLAVPFFDALLNCTNAHFPTAPITMKDLFLYHALLVLMSFYKLTDLNEYWKPEYVTWDPRIQKLIDELPRRRFYMIRNKLRGYMPVDERVPPEGKDRGWKVTRVLVTVVVGFRNLFDGPGEKLSLDEGMARGSSTRNPIYCTLGNAKPLEGNRFFLLIDYTTKCCINFMLDTKWLTAANTTHMPGGFVGAVIDSLCHTAKLLGRWYKIFMDSYYGSDQIARHLRNNRQINIVATLQKKNTCQEVLFGNAKRPKPSRANSKGAIKAAKSGDNIYMYSWMDSAAVYFVDSAYGSGNIKSIYRKDSQGARVQYLVPEAIPEYHNGMHGADVWDQIRIRFIT